MSRQERLRDDAARDIVARIQHDAARAPQRIKPLLAYIEANLFDRGFQVRRMLRECGVRDNALATVFHAEVGRPPGAYVTECRLSVAARLLVETDLCNWQISKLVAYGEHRTLSRAFKKRFGVPPRAFRSAKGAAPKSAAPASRARRDAAFEQQLAEKLWRHLRDLPPAAQLRVLRHQVPQATTALFDLLRRKSREKGRENRQHGIQLAELALASLDLCAESLAPRLPDLEACGWAGLADARRLARDFSGAEADLRRAEAQSAVGRSQAAARMPSRRS